MSANVKTSRAKVGEPTVSLLCSPCHKQGKTTKLVEATAKFIDGVSHCTECWSAYGDRLVETEPGSRRYTLKESAHVKFTEETGGETWEWDINGELVGHEAWGSRPKPESSRGDTLR